jgi:FkbM family methyltransferase
MNYRQFTTPLGKFYVHPADSAFVSTMSRGVAWEHTIISTVLASIPASGTILDIGGHIGTHSIPYALARPDCRIHTFEPQSAIRDILLKNVEANNLTNIQVHPFGLGHGEIQTHLAHDFTSDGYPSYLTVDYKSARPVNFGGLGITKKDTRGEAVTIHSVDSLHLDNVVYMKIDVEGAETLVVYGARNTIQTQKPVLLVEQSDKNVTSQFYDEAPELRDFDVTTYLQSLGYSRTDLGSCNFLYV